MYSSSANIGPLSVTYTSIIDRTAIQRNCFLYSQPGLRLQLWLRLFSIVYFFLTAKNNYELHGC